MHGGYAKQAKFYVGMEGQGTNEQNYLLYSPVSKFRIHEEYLENDRHDLAVAKLDKNVGVDVGWAALKAFKDEELKGINVNVTGYPSFYGREGFTTYLMYTMEGPIFKVDPNKAYYYIDTSGGQSGAGVWKINTETNIVECVAVHVNGFEKHGEPNEATRINKENFSTIYDWKAKFEKEPSDK